MQHNKPLSMPWVVGLGATGIVMGLLTSLVGLPQNTELGTWLGFYVVWGVVVLRRRLAPFLTPLLASLLSGVFTGVLQYLLRDAYVANNPWWAEAIAATGGMTVPAVVGFALVMGLSWGLLLGVVFWGLTKVLERRGRGTIAA